MEDIYIFSGILQGLSRQPEDLTGVPPGSFLYDAAVWEAMSKEYGGEAKMIAGFGVCDVRQDVS